MSESFVRRQDAKVFKPVYIINPSPTSRTPLQGGLKCSHTPGFPVDPFPVCRLKKVKKREHLFSTGQRAQLANRQTFIVGFPV